VIALNKKLRKLWKNLDKNYPAKNAEILNARSNIEGACLSSIFRTTSSMEVESRGFQ